MQLIIAVVLIIFIALFALLSLPMTLEEPAKADDSNKSLIG